MRSLVTVVFIVALVSCVSVQEKHKWASFKKGSWVKIKVMMNAEGKQYGWIETDTLVAVTDEEAIVKEEKKEGEGKEESEFKYSLQSKKSEKGEEEIEVAGRKWKCRVVEEAVDKDETQTLWICKEGPYEGVTIKRISVTGRGESERTVVRTLIKLDEKLKVGTKEVKCFLYDETSPDWKETGKRWISYDVPGHLVRLETKTTAPRFEYEVLVEVVDFEAKK